MRENVDDSVDAVKRAARRVDEFRDVRRDAHVPEIDALAICGDRRASIQTSRHARVARSRHGRRVSVRDDRELAVGSAGGEGVEQRRDAPDVARVDEREHDVSAVLFSSFFVCVLRFAERDDLRNRIWRRRLRVLGQAALGGPEEEIVHGLDDVLVDVVRLEVLHPRRAQHVLVHEVPVLDPPGRRGDDSERRVRHRRGRPGHGDEPLAPDEVGRRGGDGVPGPERVARDAGGEELALQCARDERHGDLRRRVRGVRREPVLVRPRRRCYRQHVRALGVPQVRRARRGDDERAFDVDVVERVVSPGIHLRARLREVRARAVHEHVDHPAVVRHRFFDRGLDLALVGNVRLDRDRVPACVNARVHGALNGARQRRVLPRRLREYHDSRSSPREPHGDGLADPARRAGDHDHAAAQRERDVIRALEVSPRASERVFPEARGDVRATCRGEFLEERFLRAPEDLLDVELLHLLARGGCPVHLHRLQHRGAHSCAWRDRSASARGRVRTRGGDAGRRVNPRRTTTSLGLLAGFQHCGPIQRLPSGPMTEMRCRRRRTDLVARNPSPTRTPRRARRSPRQVSPVSRERRHSVGSPAHTAPARCPAWRARTSPRRRRMRRS